MPSLPGSDRRSIPQRDNVDPVARYLGELQTKVMDVFWNRDSATVREALNAMNARRRQKLAYTTILTIVSRLWRRGLLNRTAEGRGYRYRAVWNRHDLLVQLSDELIDRLLDDFGDIAVARLGERLEHLDPSRFKKLKAARADA